MHNQNNAYICDLFYHKIEQTCHFIWFTFLKCSLHLKFIEVACSLTREEILQDWEWLHSNLMTTLTSFDTEEEITEFVCCKIQSIIANSIPDSQFADGRIINRCLRNRRKRRSMHKLSVNIILQKRIQNHLKLCPLNSTNCSIYLRRINWSIIILAGL